MKKSTTYENIDNILLQEVPITPKQYEKIFNIQASILQKLALMPALLVNLVLKNQNREGKITKFESLARIEHNSQLISPYKFTEPAHLSGLLPEITKIMVDR